MIMDSAVPDSPTEDSVLRHVTSIPQLLYVGRGGRISAHVAGDVDPNMDLVAGFAVTNDLNPGAMAYAYVPHRRRGEAEQQLVCTIHSSHEAPNSRVFTFTRGSGKPERELELNLYVTPFGAEDLLYATPSGTNLIPLLVAPGSISVSQKMTTAELTALGPPNSSVEELSIDWPRVLKGVVASVPILAKAGLDIYQELSGTKPQSKSALKRGAVDAELAGLIVTALASVAVPLVGSLIGRLLD